MAEGSMICEKCHKPMKEFEDLVAYGKDVRWCKDCANGLTPPDFERCQAEKMEGSFMTLGPRSMVRCENKPAFIARENEPGTDGKRGSMSLCAKCSEMFKEKMGENYATLTPIRKRG